MLDFLQIQTPQKNGQVLVLPEPNRMVQALRENGQNLDASDTKILNYPLSYWRKKTREAVAGCYDTPLIVIGHQPGFMHPGVWAKHIVATRMAKAVGGQAINLIVDHDAPKNTTFAVPALENQTLYVHPIRFADVPAGTSYEQIPALSENEINAFEKNVRQAMGDWFNDSQMSTYIQALKTTLDKSDWVDQSVDARRAVEANFNISINDHRVSHIWCGPLLIDMFMHAERFVDSYNRALSWYRKEFHVRGFNRPIPDLKCENHGCELPVWAVRGNEPRKRLYVEKSGTDLHLLTDQESIGTISISGKGAEEFLHQITQENLITHEMNGWQFRPRALTLTLWARLLLADLFIHGIGGAKYDRITDIIIADYYNTPPPKMACVSATLWMDLPQSNITDHSIHKLQHRMRDMTFNPQRHLKINNEITELMKQKHETLQHAQQLRDKEPANHTARKKVFQQIRHINQTMLNTCPDTTKSLQTDFARAKNDRLQNTIAQDRNWFFGLYHQKSLKILLDALPRQRDFRV